MNGFSVNETEDSYGPEIRWSAPQTYERMNGDDKYDTGVTQNQKSPKIPDTSNFMNLLKDNKPLMARLSANGGKWILFVPTNKAFTSKRSTLIASFDESKRDKYLYRKDQNICAEMIQEQIREMSLVLHMYLPLEIMFSKWKNLLEILVVINIL